MSWGPGLTALLGAGALFWTIGNSVRRDTKAEVAALADSTDRKIAALADAIAAMGKVHDREMANIREAQAKNTANIANLEKSVEKLEVKLDKLADDTAKGFAETGLCRIARISGKNRNRFARIYRQNRCQHHQNRRQHRQIEAAVTKH